MVSTPNRTFNLVAHVISSPLSDHFSCRVLYSYEGSDDNFYEGSDKIVVTAKGEGGIAAIKPSLREKEVQFSLLRVLDDGAPKFVFITWIAVGTSRMKLTKVKAQKQTVVALCGGGMYRVPRSCSMHMFSTVDCVFCRVTVLSSSQFCCSLGAAASQH